MRIDIHCHAIGKGTDISKVDTEVYFNAQDNQHWFTRILYNMLEDEPFDRDVRIKQAHGFSDSILENAGKVLSLPK